MRVYLTVLLKDTLGTKAEKFVRNNFAWEQDWFAPEKKLGSHIYKNFSISRASHSSNKRMGVIKEQFIKESTICEV